MSSFYFVLVWMGHLNSIPNCHSGTYLLQGFDHLIEDQNFRVEILEKNPSPRDDSNTFDGGHEPKSNLYPSQGEKECAACLLMIKLYLNDTCSDCYHHLTIFTLLLIKVQIQLQNAYISFTDSKPSKSRWFSFYHQ